MHAIASIAIISLCAFHNSNDRLPLASLKKHVYNQSIADAFNFFGIGWHEKPIKVNELIKGLSNEKIQLGRVLFYDTNLSKNNEISCSSCHQQAFSFADTSTFSLGHNGIQTKRNTPNLNDILWSISPKMMWDQAANNLSEAVLRPLFNAEEMNADSNQLLLMLNQSPFYPQLFEDAFGEKNISIQLLAEALAEFVKSMNSFNSKFDKAYALQNYDSFSHDEAEGMVIFFSACSHCHVGPQFAYPAIVPEDSILLGGVPIRVYNNGLDEVYKDKGRGEITNHQEDFGIFKSPSLKNIAFTAPYMHDGRFKTLDEVIDFYVDGVAEHPNSLFTAQKGDMTGCNMNALEKRQLKAFLLTLSDYDFIENEKWSDPFVR